MSGSTRGKRDAGNPARGRNIPGTARKGRTVGRRARTTTAGSGRNTTVWEGRGRQPPRITGRKHGNLRVSLVMWRLRMVKNRLFYIGYRLYPAYIFTTGLLLGLILPTYIWSVKMPFDGGILYMSFLIVSLLLIYYTYRWIAWKMAVKRYYARHYASRGNRMSVRRSYGRPVRRVVATRSR